MVFFYLLIFALTALVTFLLSYFVTTIYISYSRRSTLKYSYTAPMVPYTIRRDYELKPSEQTGIDGDSALKNYKRG